MSPEAAGSAAATLLVVDDDRKTRKLIRLLLENAGYRVLEAAGGEEAVELLRSQPEDIDLVLLDLVMPHMSGQECLRQMLELKPGLKALAVTAYTLDDEAYEAISSQVQALLPKPIRPPLLLTLVQRVLSGEA